ncbi:MAG: hypothetical protein JOS17DRAFT_804306 [Linnemannia elongata]|nr:MAG: hypothetical protein JOS17DRAFT_804306 [Linnemannia elongata]
MTAYQAIHKTTLMAKRQHSPRGSFTSEPTSDHSKTCSINFPLPALDTLVVGFRNGDIFRPDGILHHAKVWFDFISLQQNTYFLLRVLLLFGPYSACFPGNPVTTAKRNTEGAGENKVIWIHQQSFTKTIDDTYGAMKRANLLCKHIFDRGTDQNTPHDITTHVDQQKDIEEDVTTENDELKCIVDGSCVMCLCLNCQLAATATLRGGTMLKASMTNYVCHAQGHPKNVSISVPDADLDDFVDQSAIRLHTNGQHDDAAVHLQDLKNRRMQQLFGTATSSIVGPLLWLQELTDRQRSSRTYDTDGIKEKPH